jgi:hypothetical protein
MIILAPHRNGKTYNFFTYSRIPTFYQGKLFREETFFAQRPKWHFVSREWNHFLQRFSSAPLETKTSDEPILSMQRNIFFHKRDEVKIRCKKVFL